MRITWVVLLASLASVATAQAEVRYAERDERYQLDAYTLSGMRRELDRQLRPGGSIDARSSHGLTRSGIELRYETEAQLPQGCRIDALQVRLNLSVTLPEWRPRAPASPEDGIRIRRMLAGLAVHEAGHRRHAIAAARTIERTILSLPLAADCQLARRGIDRIYRRELMRFRLRDQHYDLVTGHGRTQGAQLDVPVRDRDRSRSATR
jgi:predicted secreted Zn-dependent protease